MTSAPEIIERPFVAQGAGDRSGRCWVCGWFIDAAVVLVILIGWWMCLSGPVREVMPLADDTYRDAAYAENILQGRIAADPSMVGLPYWYAWQVTILGLGPIWMGKKGGGEAQDRKPAQRRGYFCFWPV